MFYDIVWKTKFKGWEYENEIRKIVKLGQPDINGRYFEPFSEEPGSQIGMVLKEIYLGCRSPVRMSDLKMRMESYKASVKVEKLIPSLSGFELQPISKIRLRGPLPPPARKLH